MAETAVMDSPIVEDPQMEFNIDELIQEQEEQLQADKEQRIEEQEEQKEQEVPDTSIKSLIIDQDQIGEQVINGRKATVNPQLDFEIVQSSGPDCVIRRKTSTTSRLLVMIVSQGLYYIKNEKTGETIHLDERSMRNFWNKSDNIILNVNWLDTLQLPNESDYREGLVNVLQSEGFKVAAKNGWCKLDASDIRSCSWSTRNLDEKFNKYSEFTDNFSSYKGFFKAYNEYIELIEQDGNYTDRDRELFIDGLDSYMILCLIFGLDNTKKFMQQYIESEYIHWNRLDHPAIFMALYCAFMFPKYIFEKYNRYEEQHPNDMRRYGSISTQYGEVECDFLEDGAIYKMHREGKEIFMEMIRDLECTIDFDSFCNYIFEGERQGYTKDLPDYLREWIEYLFKQRILLDGGLEIKYPKYLSSDLKKIKYEVECIEEQHNEEMFKEQSKEMDVYNYSNDKWIFTHPKTADDMRKEAAMQSNCLATYVDKVANGRCHIVFLRKKNNKEQSYITIEINPNNNRLIQAKRKYNNSPSQSDWEVIRHWAKLRNIIIN